MSQPLLIPKNMTLEEFTKDLLDSCSFYRATINRIQVENAALFAERNRYKNALEDIAVASGFDNIGNWARNRARDALKKETMP